MVIRIPSETGSAHAVSSYFDPSPRRSLNPGCRDVQAALSAFRFSDGVAGTAESPSGAAPVSTPDVPCVSEDEYIEPSCMMDASSRRPSVQRTSSAPEASSSKSSLFVETSAPTLLRPSLARACSESRASGVLERRRLKSDSASSSLPSDLMLDLANLPMTMGAGNLGLLRAARKAITEPRGFDWGRSVVSAPSCASNSRFVTQQHTTGAIPPVRTTVVRAKTPMAASLPLPTSVSASKFADAPLAAGGASSSRSYVASYCNGRPSACDESEWEWALAGNARATYDALRFSTYKETKEPVHDIWQQLPDWVSRRSSLGGRDADLSLRGPSLHNSFATSKLGNDLMATNPAAAATAALTLSLAHVSISQSPRNSISGRGRGHQFQVPVQVPFPVLEDEPSLEGSISPRASIVASRDHALEAASNTER